MTAFLALCAIVLASCSSTKVLENDANDGFRLSQYQTFNFYDIEASGDTSDMAAYKEGTTALKNAVAKQLIARGLTQTTANPDLLVNIGIVVKDKVQTRETDFRTDAPRYMGQRRYSWKSSEVEVGRYKEGTVTLHLVNRQENKMVWKGVVSGILPNKPAKLQAQANDAMTTLFEKVP